MNAVTMVTDLRRRTRRGLMPSLFLAPGVQDGTPDVDGWFASVDLDTGASLECSKLDGETSWTVDAVWASNGAPIFSNGFGARYLALKAPAADIAKVLDDALASVTA